MAQMPSIIPSPELTVTHTLRVAPGHILSQARKQTAACPFDSQTVFVCERLSRVTSVTPSPADC